MNLSNRNVLHISPEDLARAEPLPVRQVGPGMPTVAMPWPTAPRVNGLAIASLVCAIAGIPIFGLITGLVAILLASLAFGAIREKHQKGTSLAVVGLLLGLADVVGWLVLLWVFIFKPEKHLRIEDFLPDPAAFNNLDPTIRRAMSANVLIESHTGLLGRNSALGSGVILEITGKEATILTNRHVVDPEFEADEAAPPGAKGSLAVYFVDRSSGPGRVMWLAPGGIDLAIVRVTLSTAGPQAAKWKLDRPLKIGDPVFAIGNPHGLGWTHTQGTISQLRLQQIAGRQLRVIQTQTVINAGNSGGGLYDKEGYLVGINSWTEDKKVSEGLNFALALDALAVLTPPGLDLKAGSKEP